MGFVKDLDNLFCVRSGLLPKEPRCIFCDSENVQIFWHHEKAIFVCPKCLDIIIALATDAIVYKTSEHNITIKKQLVEFIERVCDTYKKVLNPKSLKIEGITDYGDFL